MSDYKKEQEQSNAEKKEKRTRKLESMTISELQALIEMERKKQAKARATLNASRKRERKAKEVLETKQELADALERAKKGEEALRMVEYIRTKSWTMKDGDNGEMPALDYIRKHMR